MRFVLDTNIIIDNLRGGRVWSQFLSALNGDSEIFLPTVVAFELFSGLSSKRKLIIDKINRFENHFRKIDLTWEIARKAAEIHRDIPSGVEAFDCIIAATALEIGAQVVTLNNKHFSKIPGLQIYPL